MILLNLPRPLASTTTGRGVMSISGLSYGVVRVEEQGSITSLTLQDVGLVMPGGKNTHTHAHARTHTHTHTHTPTHTHTHTHTPVHSMCRSETAGPHHDLHVHVHVVYNVHNVYVYIYKDALK